MASEGDSITALGIGEIHADHSMIEQTLVNQWATSYLSNHDSRLHIGLGSREHIDQIEITWSNGNKEV